MYKRQALAQRVERLERRLEGGEPPTGAAPRSTTVQPPDPEEVRATRTSTAAGEGAAPATESPAERQDSGEREPEAAAEQHGGAEAGGTVTAAAETIDLERITGLWPAVVDQVRQSGSELLSTVYEAARPLAVDAEAAVLKVGFPPSAAFNKRKAEAEANRERFADAVKTIVGERLRPVYVLLDGEPEDDANGAGAPTEDEMIEHVRSEFDAEFVEADAEPKEGSE